MLTAWLPLPFLTQGILFIPDVMLRTFPTLPFRNMDLEIIIFKKISLIPPSWSSLFGVEKPACSPEKDEETNVLLISLWSHWLCLVQSGSNLHMAVCRGEPLTVFIPGWETSYVQLSLSWLWLWLKAVICSLMAVHLYTLAFSLAFRSGLSGVI